jgi:hypothetical protein
MGRGRRSEELTATWDSSRGGFSRAETLDGAAAVTLVSTKLFHSWQLGQRPSHFRLSLPQFWQTKIVLADLSDLPTE